MQKKSLSIYQAEEPTPAARDWPPLPVPLTSFVGREQEIASICALLRRPEIRLLSLIGTGGVGKTRLSLQVATRLSQDFVGQICFVSLMEIADPDLVVPTIAQALGLQELGSRPTLEHLKAFLQEKRLLLLLDNFEQVMAAAPALTTLLRDCAGLKILVTSRAVLRISGEQPFLVTPLTLPDLAQLPEREELRRSPAITLFLERARTLLPAFDLTRENSRVVAEICIHLDGVPLAIELAVPRLKLLSPAMLLERLEHRFQVLSQGMRDTPGRHQTLQNTLEWSYRLLNPSEQQLFRCLAIFVGGCTLQALETVWELSGHPAEKEQALKRVASLLDKSMLYRATPETEEPRLLLLRTLREYGLHRLALTGELEQMQWAHARYFLALAEQAKPKLKGPQPRRWLERLEREQENLREALNFLLTCGEHGTGTGTELALRLGTALERFWIIGGHIKEGRDLLDRALRRRQGVSSAVRGYALSLLATLARYQGDFQAAAAAGAESLAIFRALGNPVGIAGALARSGYVAWMRGDAETARTLYEESLALAQGEACRDARNETLYCFASLAFFAGDASTARPMIEESLALSKALQDQYNFASALNILGWISLLQEDVAAARALQEESLQANRQLGNQRGMAHTLSALGEIAFQQGDFAQAWERYKEGLEIIIRLGDQWIATIYLDGLARVALARHEAVRAVHFLSAAEALRRSMGTSVTPIEKAAYEQTLTTLHTLLEEHIFATAWAEGQAMSPEKAIAAVAPATPVRVLSQHEKQPVTNVLPAHTLHDDLTPRERDVLRLVAQGLTDVQVAQRLVISHRTVNFHLTSIYRKLQVSSRSAATRYALECHLC